MQNPEKGLFLGGLRRVRPCTIKGVGFLGIWYGFSRISYLTRQPANPILLNLNSSIYELIRQIRTVEELDIEIMKLKNDPDYESFLEELEKEKQKYESKKAEVIQNTQNLINFIEQKKSTTPKKIKLSVILKE